MPPPGVLDGIRTRRRLRPQGCPPLTWRKPPPSLPPAAPAPSPPAGPRPPPDTLRRRPAAAPPPGRAGAGPPPPGARRCGGRLFRGGALSPRREVGALDIGCLGAQCPAAAKRRQLDTAPDGP